MSHPKPTVEQKEKLILSVQKFPTVWDISCKSYHDIIAKTNCWKKISEKCCQTGEYICFIQICCHVKNKSIINL